MKKETLKVKANLAQMLKGGVIMDVTSPEQAKIAEEAGAVSVIAGKKFRRYKSRRRSGEDVRPEV